MIFFKVLLPKDSQAVVLEDSPMRIAWFQKRLPQVTICTSIKEFQAYFDRKPICDFIFLDHDLGEGNGNGVDAANEIKERFGGNTSAMLIHSWNHVGVKNMQAVLKDAPAMPFGNFELEVEKD